MADASNRHAGPGPAAALELMRTLVCHGPNNVPQRRQVLILGTYECDLGWGKGLRGGDC